MYNKEQFQAWVASQDEGALVGMTASRCNCPLANFYKPADKKYKNIAMGKRKKTWAVELEFISEEHQPWEMKFINDIDKLNRRLVSREEILHALET